MNKTLLSTKDETLGTCKEQKIIEFKRRKPKNVTLHIDFEKGWKFTEDDKPFLIAYYEDYLQTLKENCDGDFTEEIEEILTSLKEKGVESSKELIQEDARVTAESVMDMIYDYYSGEKAILHLIENSILDVR